MFIFKLCWQLSGHQKCPSLVPRVGQPVAHLLHRLCSLPAIPAEHPTPTALQPHWDVELFCCCRIWWFYPQKHITTKKEKQGVDSYNNWDWKGPLGIPVVPLGLMGRLILVQKRTVRADMKCLLGPVSGPFEVSAETALNSEWQIWGPSGHS